MSDVVFFSTWHILGNRSLNQKNLKKLEVSCKAEIPKNKYKKKTSIPILKTQIRGRERLRSEEEKDSDQRKRKTQAAAIQASEPQAAATQAREPQAWVAHGLRLAQLGATRRASSRPRSRTVV